MDPSQTKALAALEPFVQTVLSAKSPTPRFLADIITRATSAQGTYAFTELLQLEAIQSLRSSDESSSYLTLLEIFSWGTWEEYHAAANLPSLNEAQALKLRQLTLLTLAASPSFALTYPNLMKALDLSSPSELESLVTTTIYAGLLTARLSPTSSPPLVHITSTAPLRDLKPLSIPQLMKVLEVWDNRCTTVMNDIQDQIEGVKVAARKRKALESQRDNALETALKEAKAESKDSKSAGAQGSNPRAGGVGGGRGHAGVPVRTGGIGGRPARGGNKRDLEETEDDADANFDDAQESAGLATMASGMDLDEGSMTHQGKTAGRLAKKRGPG